MPPLDPINERLNRPAPPTRRMAATALFAVTAIGAALAGAWPTPLVAAPYDKLAHAGVFFTLMLTAAAAWPRYGASALTAAALSALGLLGECAQVLTAARQADAGDALANIAGVLAALAARSLWRYGAYRLSVSRARRARRAADVEAALSR